MDDTGTRQKSFPMSLWLQFVLCTGVIFLSGSRLSLIADIIAEKTGLGRTWIGVILLASVKSLPELITAFRFFLFVCSGSVLLQTHRVRSSTFPAYLMHPMTTLQMLLGFADWPTLFALAWLS